MPSFSGRRPHPQLPPPPRFPPMPLPDGPVHAKQVRLAAESERQRRALLALPYDPPTKQDLATTYF